MLAGEVPVWRARLIARETTDLCVEGRTVRGPADRRHPAQDRAGQGRPAGAGGPAVLRPRPRHRRRGRSPHQARCLAAPRHGAPATTDVTMTLDTPDALLFDQTVTRIAGDLSELGDTEDLDVRRARAVGILADPQYALDLLSGREAQHPAAVPAVPRTSTCTSPPQTWPRTSTRRHRVLPRSRSSARPPLSCSPTGSPGSQQPAPRSPCAPSSTSGRDAAVDQHDPPEAMRETVVAARRALRLPRLPPRLPDLRPRPHHRVPPHGRRRTTGPNPARQSRAAVPIPSPREDPHRLALQTPRRRQL